MVVRGSRPPGVVQSCFTASFLSQTGNIVQISLFEQTHNIDCASKLAFGANLALKPNIKLLKCSAQTSEPEPPKVSVFVAKPELTFVSVAF